MTIACTHEGGITIAKLSGRLDSGSSNPALVELLSNLDEIEPHLLLDASELEYVSSAGLRTLLGVAKKIRSSGGKVAIAAMKDPIREIFEISGFHSIIPPHPDLASARAALSE